MEVRKCGKNEIYTETPLGEKLVLGSDFDRMQAERDALQLRLSEVEEENDRLRSAVKFYADKNHISDDMRSDWDVVSCEPYNILWHEEEPWFVEDGSIAKHALEAKQ